MKITYSPLFALLAERNIPRRTLRFETGICSNTYSSLLHDEHVNTATIMRVCEYLQCQPGDIMECIDDE
ncbi:MAG: helix-turn-helix transcriptional regulator [Muribaculaceae bacterium]|nr:helix-turn-helix transcriptional regulator [Muribaculaceae bacterium]